MWVKLLVVVLSLGMDTLAASIALGLDEVRSRYRIALTFAAAEGLMLAGGIWLGGAAGRFLPRGLAPLFGAHRRGRLDRF